MNPLISHIEFLLHDHNCVIIPDFGGFVVNTIPPRRDGIATFLPPVCELVFNRDLTHNDGLLPQSYMKNGGISFEAATQKVEQDVKDLKRQLQEQRHLDMGKLGTFTMHDDKRFVYAPGSFVRPALFGLTEAILKPVIQIQPAVQDRKNENRRRWSRSAAVSAAAVAAIAVLMLILPVSDTAFDRQSARMISETSWFTPKVSSAANGSVSIDEVLDVPRNMEDLMASEIAMEKTIPAVDAKEDITDNSPKYYIVMGVFSSIESARKTAQQLQEEGFNQAKWLERTERFDVYAASFTDKNAADVYLKEVHKKYPGHIDAWILKR